MYKQDQLPMKLNAVFVALPRLRFVERATFHVSAFLGTQVVASTCQHCGVRRTLGILSSRQDCVGTVPYGQMSVNVFGDTCLIQVICLDERKFF